MAFNWDGRIDYEEKKRGKEYEGSSPLLGYAVNMEMKLKATVKAEVTVDFGRAQWRNYLSTHIGNVKNDAMSDSEI